MKVEQDATQSHDDKLAEAIERYLSTVESGEKISRDEFLKQHAEIADDLAACLDSLDFIEESLGASPATSVIACGQQFGEYHVLRDIARGGMGVVYEAFHLGLERRVALKVLSGKSFREPKQRERFLREAKTAAGLHHTNIVPVFEVGELDGICYYAMQYIEGESLGAIIRDLRSKRLAGLIQTSALASGPHSDAYFREAARITAQAADALAYAHRLGVVHRDIKPSNLILDADGTAWVTDFGLAFRSYDAVASGSAEPVGTPLYMSPEQATPQQSVDYRTDIYSLGATLYELLTLRPMFEAGSTLAVLTQIVSRQPPAPTKINPHIPRDLDAIVRRATARDPADRYADAEEFADDLRRFVHHEPVRARPIGPAGRFIRWCRREPRLAAVTAAALIVLVALSGWYHAAVVDQRNLALVAKSAAEFERDRAATAENNAIDNLWQALYQQARATRLSFQNNRRLTAIDLITKARDIRDDPVLRDEAIAALSLHSARLQSTLQVSGTVEMLTFCPDGNYLACGTRDGSVQLWQLDGSEPIVLAAGGHDIQSIVFSQCGRLIATAIRNGPIDVWDIQSQQQIASIGPGDINPDYLVFVGRPTRLVALSFEGACQQWELSNGHMQPLESRELGRWFLAARGPTNESITLLQGSGDLVNWNLVSGESEKVMAPYTRGRLTSIAWDPAGKLLAIGHRTGTVDLFAPSDAQSLKSLGGHRGWVRAMGFNANGTLLAASGIFDPNVKIWDTSTGEMIASMNDPHSRTRAVSFSPDGNLVAVGGDKTISLWTLITPRSVRRLGGHDDAVARITFTPDSQHLISGSADGVVLSWPTASTNPPNKIVTVEPNTDTSFRDPRGCTGLSVSSKGDRVAVRDRAGTIQVWDLATGKLAESLKSTRIWGGPPHFVNDGQELVRTHDRAVQRWRIGATEPVSIAQTAEPILNSATSSDNRYVAVSTWQNRVEVFEIETGTASCPPLGLETTVTAVALSSDGKLLAAGDRLGGVHIFQLPSGSLLKSWKESDEISSLAFRPDDRWLGITCRDGLVQLRDASSGAAIAQLPGHAGGTRSITFSPNGMWLATGGDDKLIQLWKLDSLHRELREMSLAW